MRSLISALLLSVFCMSAVAQAEEYHSKVVAVVANETGYTFVFHKEAPDNWRVVGDAVRKLHSEEDLATISVETKGRQVHVSGICPEQHFNMSTSTRVNASKPDTLYVSTTHEYVFEFADSDQKVEGELCKQIGRFTLCISDCEHVSLTLPIGKVIAGVTQHSDEEVIK